MASRLLVAHGFGMIGNGWSTALRLGDGLMFGLLYGHSLYPPVYLISPLVLPAASLLLCFDIGHVREAVSS